MSQTNPSLPGALARKGYIQLPQAVKEQFREYFKILADGSIVSVKRFENIVAFRDMNTTDHRITVQGEDGQGEHVYIVRDRDYSFFEIQKAPIATVSDVATPAYDFNEGRNA